MAAGPRPGKPVPVRMCRCERCGFECPWWVGAERYKLCSTCQREQRRIERERMRQRARELAELESIEDAAVGGID